MNQQPEEGDDMNSSVLAGSYVHHLTGREDRDQALLVYAVVAIAGPGNYHTFFELLLASPGEAFRHEPADHFTPCTARVDEVRKPVNGIICDVKILTTCLVDGCSRERHLRTSNSIREVEATAG